MIYYRKNHWSVIIINFIKLIKKLWAPMLLILIPTLSYIFITLPLWFGGIFVFCFLKWLNEFIVMNNNNVLYKKGIFYNQTIKIPLDSISLVESNQNLLYFILGLRQIKIESISPTDRHFEITIILKKKKGSEFQALIEKLENEKIKENKEINGKIRYKISFTHLLILATLRSNIFLGIGIIYSILHVLYDVNKKMGVTIKNLLINNIGFGDLRSHRIIEALFFFFIIMIIVIIIILLFSIVGLVCKYYRFRVYRNNNHIYIKHGLIVRRNYSVKIENIHAIKVEQNFINQILNLYTIKASIVGFGNQISEGEIMFPICNEKECKKIINDLIPEFAFNELMVKSPDRAFNNFYISWISISVIFAVVLYLLFGTIAGIIAVPIMITWRYLLRKNCALGIGENILVFSCGSFSKKQILIRNSSMIQCTKVVNLFQRRKSICDYRIKFYNQKKLDLIRVKNMDNMYYDDIKSNMDKGIVQGGKKDE